MRVDIFTLCDNAQQYEGGKLVIVGTFNNVYAKSYPINLQSFSLVTRIIFGKEEAGSYNIKVSIKNADSDTYLLPAWETKVTTPSNDEEKTVNFIVNGNNVRIPAEGNYVATLAIRGKTYETGFVARLRK